MEVTIDNLEDMCALMCDNYIPKGEKNDNKNSGDNTPSDVLLDTGIHHREV